MKHLFFSVVLFFAVLAFPALAADNSPDKTLIDEAEKGNAWRQLQLGMWNESHHQYAEAAKWFHKAAEQGNTPARYHLGVLYENGQGVPLDYWEAVKWYWQAAEQGNIPAQERLGVLIQHGRGMQKNDMQAYMWFDIAALQDDREAQKHCDILEKTLTSKQVAEAKRSAHEWMQQHPASKIDY